MRISRQWISRAEAGAGARVTARPLAPHGGRSRSIVLLAVLAIAGLGLASPARAAEPLLPDTGSRAGAGPRPSDRPADPFDDEVLIRFAPGTTARQRVEVVRGAGVTPIEVSADGRTAVVSTGGRATATVRRELAGDQRVVAVAANHHRELTLDPAAEPSFADLWALDNSGQTLAGTTQETGIANIDIDGREAIAAGLGDPGVVVAVIDDGVDFSHPDLAAAAWTNPGESGAKATNGIDDDHNGYIDDVHGWDFCNDDATVHDQGSDGHGTHVAGTIGAALDGAGIVGVAPGVRIMALKFIDHGWSCGRDDMAVQAIDYAASFGVRIINASWGGPQSSSVLDAAIRESGALFVAAAGNGGANLDASGSQRFYPASSTEPNVLSVAAVDQTGHLASFSDYGATSVDLGAPGTNILSTYPARFDCPSPCYAWSAGTSMAAPHVSGVAALVGSHQAGLLTTPLALKARLLATGRPLAALQGRTSSGRMVNAMQAIDAEKPVASAPDRYGFGVGTIIGSRSIRTYVRWPAARDVGTGVSSYTVKRNGPEGWTDAGTGVTGLSVTNSLRYSTGYRFRVRATDGAGNLSGPADGSTVVASLYPDSTRLASYGPGWTTSASKGATGAVMHTTYKGGTWMQLSMTGRALAIVGPQGVTRGSFKVYVDGIYAGTASAYRASARSRVVLFAQSWPTSAPHTVRLVAAGTAGHSRVDIDAFVVIR